MERMYQRGKIQEESIYYETQKHTGEFPIIGVNTFLNSEGSPTVKPDTVIRSTQEEKNNQIKQVNLFKKNNKNELQASNSILEEAVRKDKNIFEAIMSVSKKQSLGQITQKLFQLGGEYRRNM